METPSSVRIAARSNTRTKSRALHDITNDSPIVGLASGGLSEKTPSSMLAKTAVIAKATPGSGESLLRGQVKNLLHKVEEDTEFVKKPTAEPCPAFKALLRHLQSPAHLLAPTPENTPLISAIGAIVQGSAMKDDDVADKSIMSQVVETLDQETLSIEECEINRALQFDSPNKSEVSDCNDSSITCEVSPLEESDASAWSVQVNASLSDGQHETIDDEIGEEVVDDEKQGEGEGEEDYYEEEEYYEDAEDDGDWYDVLCEGMSNMTVKEEAKLPQFCGKHTRFVYSVNGDEEEMKVVSPNVVVLKGMPLPEGKHLRFQQDEEEN